MTQISQTMWPRVGPVDRLKLILTSDMFKYCGGNMMYTNDVVCKKIWLITQLPQTVWRCVGPNSLAHDAFLNVR